MIMKKLSPAKKFKGFRVSEEVDKLLNIKLKEESISLTDFLNQAILLRSIIPNEIIIEAKRKAGEIMIENIKKNLMEYLNRENH